MKVITDSQLINYNFCSTRRSTEAKQFFSVTYHLRAILLLLLYDKTYYIIHYVPVHFSLDTKIFKADYFIMRRNLFWLMILEI